MSDLRAAVEAVRAGGRARNVRCPAHDDHQPSLSVFVNSAGDVRLQCHVGCAREAVLEAAGLTWRDLHREAHRGGSALGQVAEYRYCDRDGTYLYDVVRFEPKAFRQRRADGAWSMAGVRRVLYRLPDLQGEPTVYIVEGEKDADALHGLALPTTSNVGGAGKWRNDYTRQLLAAGVEDVVILPDNDDPGRQHAATIAQNCHEAGLGSLPTEAPGVTVAALKDTLTDVSPTTLTRALDALRARGSVSRTGAGKRGDPHTYLRGVEVSFQTSIPRGCEEKNAEQHDSGGYI